MKIVFKFKSGFVLPVTCEEFEYSTNLNGELTEYSMKGIEDNKPIFFRAEDIECIWRDMRFNEE